MKTENVFYDSNEEIAKVLDNYYQREFLDESDYDGILQSINAGEILNLGSTTAEYDNTTFDVELDVKNRKINYLVNNNIVNTEQYDIFDLIQMLKYVTFDELLEDDNFPGYTKYSN